MSVTIAHNLEIYSTYLSSAKLWSTYSICVHSCEIWTIGEGNHRFPCLFSMERKENVSDNNESLLVMLARLLQQGPRPSIWPHGDLSAGVSVDYSPRCLLCFRELWGGQEQNEVSGSTLPATWRYSSLKPIHVSSAGLLQRLFPVHLRSVTTPTHKAWTSWKTWRASAAFWETSSMSWALWSKQCPETLTSGNLQVTRREKLCPKCLTTIEMTIVIASKSIQKWMKSVNGQGFLMFCKSVVFRD